MAFRRAIALSSSGSAIAASILSMYTLEKSYSFCSVGWTPLLATVLDEAGVSVAGTVVSAVGAFLSSPHENKLTAVNSVSALRTILFFIAKVFYGYAR